MYKYIIIFLVSYLFAFLSEKNNDKKKISFIFSLIAVIIPCIIAGMRESGIGTDTNVYIDGVFSYMVRKVNSMQQLVEYINMSSIEPLYMLLNYVVSKFSNSLSVLYFTLELIIVLPVFLGCKNLSKKINIPASTCYLVFLLLFFNKSLNMCRQSIAMSICFYSINFILDKKFFKYILLIVTAYFFHKSSILFFPVYFINSLLESNKKYAKITLVLIIVFLLYGILLFKPIVLFLINIGVLNSKYMNYILLYGAQNNIKLIEIISEVAALIIILFISKRVIKASKYNKLYIYISIIAFITFLFGYNAAYSQRISYYFSMCLIVLLPQFGTIFKTDRFKKAMSLFMIVFIMIYSFIYYEKYKFDQTVPYKIDISSNKTIKK